MKPLVSVSIPCYNAEKTIEATVNCVLGQTYRDFELVVCDNCSTDRTLEKLQSIKDPRLKVFRNETNLGMVGNFQRVLTRATGKYVKCLCADDILEPDCIEKQVNAFLQHPGDNLVMVCAEKKVIDKNGKVLFKKGFPGRAGVHNGIKAIKKSIRLGTNIFGEPGCVLFDREAAMRTGGFSVEPDLGYMVDFSLYANLLKAGNLFVIKEQLFSFRITASTASAGIKWDQAKVYNLFVVKYLCNRGGVQNPYSRPDGFQDHGLADVHSPEPGFHDARINLILGAGLAGLGAARTLRARGEPYLVIEKEPSYGGLCGNFEIDGFRFDKFVHFSFTENPEVNKIFSESSPEQYRHIPNPFNIYRGKWIKHPAQNNLFPLEEWEKRRIIADFLARKPIDEYSIHNYEDWLRAQYGNYFAENFPMAYTRKYWMREARELETGWIGKRLYQPSVDEIIQGSKTAETPVTYYGKEMRYPKSGGFKSYLKSLAADCKMIFNERVIKINSGLRYVETASGNRYYYKRLISSLPLPVVVGCMDHVPETVLAAASNLHCTCGYLVSVGLRTKRIPPYLWWYIYDEGNLASRVYAPSHKSPDNVPDGCSSLQLEIYCERGRYSREELIRRSVGHLVETGVLQQEDILFTDVRHEQFANVIFTHSVYRDRAVVREYLSLQGIETIGRFGEWDYLWSDQSLLSGLNIK